MQILAHLVSLRLLFRSLLAGKPWRSAIVQEDAGALAHQQPFVKRLLLQVPAWQQTVASWDTVELSANMTLLLLILYAGHFWYLEIPMTILCVAAFLYPPLKRNPNFWFIATILLAAAHYYNWYLIDNHKYLLTYWSLALYCSLLTPNPARAIKVNAQLLIGLTFLFATFWKIISDDFLNSTFFHYSLLMDDRFASVAVLLGGINVGVLVQNHTTIKEMLAYDSLLPLVQLQSSAQIDWLARFITGWTIGIESVTALAFLWPHDQLLSKWRDLPLLLFLLTTYMLAPVIGFGWILVIMGITQCSASFRYMRLLYVATFFILQIYLMPWATIISALLPVG